MSTFNGWRKKTDERLFTDYGLSFIGGMGCPLSAGMMVLFQIIAVSMLSLIGIWTIRNILREMARRPSKRWIADQQKIYQNRAQQPMKAEIPVTKIVVRPQQNYRRSGYWEQFSKKRDYS